MSLQVFGTKPKDSIFLPQQPYSVRLNCQAGQIAISDDEYLGNSMEISIIGVKQMFGSLGKTRDTDWLQIFFIPAPSCKILPSNTVCVSYIKTRSLSQFNQKITQLMESGEPAEGIFIISFQSHQNGKGDPYKSVKFDWRPRKTAEEKKQLEEIIGFMQNNPILGDANGTREMLPVRRESEADRKALVPIEPVAA
ncbi:hypothetical protein Syn7502_02828 [Synechococcus sp. PCC 7502]|uniref:hypothetical protein n=1 Tax=Synechococcus sp. PCC 7502 TaxID=1173263 RepID=UPI00029FC3C8|nr:hypothetical protein [Synechococcus sp. PCC 7502]AFY74765.1 hypothetical protein Syn7502_02828 [Synechococcus sp. PCC 7502]